MSGVKSSAAAPVRGNHSLHPGRVCAVLQDHLSVSASASDFVIEKSKLIWDFKASTMCLNVFLFK